MATPGFNPSQSCEFPLGDNSYWHSNNPALSSVGSFDADYTHQHPHRRYKRANAEEKLYPSHVFDFRFRSGAHGFPIQISVGAK